VEKKFNSFLKVSYLQLLFSAILIILTTIAVFIFWSAFTKAEQVLTERIKLREFILARAGALAISDFFDSRKTKLLILADLPEIKTIDLVKGRATTQKFVQDMKERPITSLGVVDKNGIIIWSENPQQEKVVEGVDLSDRDYFLWAKNQKKPGSVYFSKPVVARTGPAKDSWIIVMATPFFSNDQFNGALYAVITTKDLVEKYVTPLTVSPFSIQMILTGDGVVVASTVAENTETNIFQINPRLGNDIIKDQDGGLVAELNLVKNKPVKTIVGYAPIKAANQSWFLMVSVPYSEVREQMNPFSEVQNESLILLFMGLIIMILFYIIAIRVAERQGYRVGYSDGQGKAKKIEDKKE
jgi:hypothetical protein